MPTRCPRYRARGRRRAARTTPGGPAWEAAETVTDSLGGAIDVVNYTDDRANDVLTERGWVQLDGDRAVHGDLWNWPTCPEPAPDPGRGEVVILPTSIAPDEEGLGLQLAHIDEGASPPLIYYTSICALSLDLDEIEAYRCGDPPPHLPHARSAGTDDSPPRGRDTR